MKRDDLICICLRVTSEDLRNAVANGAKSFAEVQEMTRVSTSCRRCKQGAQSIVEQLLQEQLLQEQKALTDEGKEPSLF